jgi:hypothetical protein
VNLLRRFLWTSKEIEDSRIPLKNNNDYLSKMKERRSGSLMAPETLLGVDRLFFTLVLMPLPRRIHSRIFNSKIEAFRTQFGVQKCEVRPCMCQFKYCINTTIDHDPIDAEQN